MITLNTIFWSSLVGSFFFIINSINNIFKNKSSNKNDNLQSEYIFHLINATLTIIFITISVQLHIQHFEINNQPQKIESFSPIGKIYQKNIITNKIDTIFIYTKN